MLKFGCDQKGCDTTEKPGRNPKCPDGWVSINGLIYCETHAREAYEAAFDETIMKDGEVRAFGVKPPAELEEGDD